MRVDVVLLPRDLQPEHLDGRAVVVFDVLRGDDVHGRRPGGGGPRNPHLRRHRPAAPPLKENRSPALPCSAARKKRFRRPVLIWATVRRRSLLRASAYGRTLFISTTNGTRAILAARGAAAIFIGALVNASATARAVAEMGLNVTLLCAGTNGQIAMEDLLGCGAVLDAMNRSRPVIEESDTRRIARRLFAAARHDLTAALRESQGGQNVLAVNLAPDIDFAASLDRLDIVGRVVGDPPVVVAGIESVKRAQSSQEMGQKSEVSMNPAANVRGPISDF